MAKGKHAAPRGAARRRLANDSAARRNTRAGRRETDWLGPLPPGAADWTSRPRRGGRPTAEMDWQREEPTVALSSAQLRRVAQAAQTARALGGETRPLALPPDARGPAARRRDRVECPPPRHSSAYYFTCTLLACLAVFGMLAAMLTVDVRGRFLATGESDTALAFSSDSEGLASVSLLGREFTLDYSFALPLLQAAENGARFVESRTPALLRAGVDAVDDAYWQICAWSARLIGWVQGLLT